MRVFDNYLNQIIILADDSWKHISENHPEISLEMIYDALRNPDHVLMSQLNPASELYFLRRKETSKERFTLVVVKVKSDGSWVSTAMTKSKVSGGVEIFRRTL